MSAHPPRSEAAPATAAEQQQDNTGHKVSKANKCKSKGIKGGTEHRGGAEGKRTQKGRTGGMRWTKNRKTEAQAERVGNE